MNFCCKFLKQEVISFSDWITFHEKWSTNLPENVKLLVFPPSRVNPKVAYLIAVDQKIEPNSQLPQPFPAEPNYHNSISPIPLLT
jgi:hypothetical protein